jgi:hypothetical protein
MADDDEVIVIEEEEEEVKPKKQPSKKRAAEDDEPPTKKEKKIKTRKGTEITFTSAPGSGGGGPTKLTKKELDAERKAKGEETVYVIAPKQGEEGKVEIPGHDPRAQMLDKMTASQLKDILRVNKQLLGGTKSELVQRCLDGMVNGAIPKCSICAHGQLRYDYDRGMYTCGGYFDDVVKARISCKNCVGSVTRGPWLLEAGDDDDAVEVVDNNNNNKAAATSLLSRSDMEQVAACGSNIKEATVKLLVLLRGAHMQLPTDDRLARQKVGPVLLSLAGSGELNADIVDSAVRTLSQEFKVVKPGDAAAGAAAAGGPQAKVPANQSLSDLFDELAKLEKDAGGENSAFKAKACKVAAIAIRTLEFEVESGAQVSKGKQKVPGIGKGSGLIIDDYIESGRTKSSKLDELKAKLGLA